MWKPAQRAGLKLENFLKENPQPIKQDTKKKYRKKDTQKKVECEGELYFVIRKGESCLRYTQRLSSSETKLKVVFTIFYVLVFNFTFLNIFEKKLLFFFFLSFLNLHGLNFKGARDFASSSLTSVWELGGDRKLSESVFWTTWKVQETGWVD